MIYRERLIKEIASSLKNYPVTAILGIRQCGKTTISNYISKKYSTTIFDLEDPVSTTQLEHAPMITLESLQGLVIIDEIQRMPQLFQILRVLSDRKENNTRFLILGSASPRLIKESAETLSGRVSYIDMSGFTIDEIAVSDQNKLWLKGGLPLSYLSSSIKLSYNWRANFVRTFLERDIPNLGINVPTHALRRFWTMLAHFHGQIWNGSDFARSLSVTEPTARKYLDILTDAYVIRQLSPWHENISKRQVKAPKIYIRDTGLLHFLLSLEGNQIMSHPKLGLSWEGFVIEQIISIMGTHNFYFWATHAGAELDLLMFGNNKRTGIEIKFSDAPRTTKSMHIAIDNLKLDRLIIVYPGNKTYKLTETIVVVGLAEIINYLKR